MRIIDLHQSSIASRISEISQLPPEVQRHIEFFAKRGHELNPNVRELVFTLNEAGFVTALSGDIYGSGLVYTDLTEESFEKVNPQSPLFNRNREGWKFTSRNIDIAKWEVLGTKFPVPSQLPPPALKHLSPEEWAEYWHNLQTEKLENQYTKGTMWDRRRVARPGNKPITRKEAIQVVKMLL